MGVDWRGGWEISGLKLGKEMPCFDEFVEEIVVCFWIWKEGIAFGDGDGECGEDREEQLMEYRGWLLGMDVGGVGG